MGAVRHDLPILLAASLSACGVRDSVVVDDVDAQAGQATATWHAGIATNGTATLRFRSNVWWLTGEGDATTGSCGRDATSSAAVDTGGGFRAILSRPNGAPVNVSLHGRAPTIGEMQPTPGEDAVYFFGLSSPDGPAAVPDGTVLTVWFPFVLDLAEHYRLFLNFTRPDLSELPGALKDNALSFTLPAFVVTPQKTALGEIDGDPVPIR